MHDAIVQRFVAPISAQTGLHIPAREYSRLLQIVATRMRLLRQPDPETYYNLRCAKSGEGDREWSALISHVTTGESYFFRDQGQFALLQKRVLPELIERRQAQRVLRLWSAGCSSGEEPYSLAMLLDELLPRRGDERAQRWRQGNGQWHCPNQCGRAKAERNGPELENNGLSRRADWPMLSRGGNGR